jgi:hypothetical protein
VNVSSIVSAVSVALATAAQAYAPSGTPAAFTCSSVQQESRKADAGAGAQAPEGPRTRVEKDTPTRTPASESASVPVLASVMPASAR